MRRPTGIRKVEDSAKYLSYRFGHEINSTAFLSLPLIQVGQWLVTVEMTDTGTG